MTERVFRETLLWRFETPKDREALVHFGEYLDRLMWEYGETGGDEPLLWFQFRAIAADLRHLPRAPAFRTTSSRTSAPGSAGALEAMKLRAAPTLDDETVGVGVKVALFRRWRYSGGNSSPETIGNV